MTPHLLEELAAQNNQGKKIRTTIDADLQAKLNRVCSRQNRLLKNNEIHNLAILVIDVPSKEVVAYVGNAQNAGLEHGQSVNIITAPRSTGSILKPLLYAAMLQEGVVLPNALIPDIPTYLQDFRPKNFSDTYDGAVPAAEALSRSLNIPFVRMLQQFGTEKFHFKLKKLGITSLHRPPNHYGLSLILGGAEASLWDLTNVYASMAHRLHFFYKNSGEYDEADFEKAIFEKTKNAKPAKLSQTTNYLTASTIWHVFEAMRKLERPSERGDWERFSSRHKIAWKTGTSHGFKDAWAIGVNPKFAVGVWVGNADGEGRPGLTGVRAAAPVLFEVFDQLPPTAWFDQPFDEMKWIATCKESGYLAKEGCPVDSLWVTKPAIESLPCPYHQLIHLDQQEKWQVTKACAADEPISKYWFVLPPVEEHYFKPKHPNYRHLPPVHPACAESIGAEKNAIELVYPAFSAKIYVPVELGGQRGKTVFQAIHKNANAEIHWHIDQEYIGTTKEFHDMELHPAIGKHLLTLVDQDGNRLEQRFEIISKE